MKGHREIIFGGKDGSSMDGTAQRPHGAARLLPPFAGTGLKIQEDREAATMENVRDVSV